MISVPWLVYCKVKKKRFRKKWYDGYYNEIFAVHRTWIFKSSFKSREHAQKKEHVPYFEVSIQRCLYPE